MDNTKGYGPTQLLSYLHSLTGKDWVMITYESQTPERDPLVVTYSSIEELVDRYIVNEKIAFLYFPSDQHHQRIADYIYTIAEKS